MNKNTPRKLVELAYHDWAQRYLRSLPPEHFMEATSQATQRKITVESFDIIHVQRPDIQTFSELLVQYPRKGKRRPGQVVPDNMAVVHDQLIDAEGSFDLPLQPVGPFWVMEYISKSSRRKDNDESFEKYEKELKVPYLAMFTPDDQELAIHKHTGKRYVSVPPDGNGRSPIPELELEVGLLDGWMRFWFRGKLVPLPADLQRGLDEANRRADAATKRADDLEPEVQRLRDEVQRLKGLPGS